MALWRPFEDEACQNQPKAKQTRMRITVGDNEKEIVMRAYMSSYDEGWHAVLEEVKETVEHLPLSSRLIDYYNQTESDTCIRRIQRIVAAELKNAASERADQTGQPHQSGEGRSSNTTPRRTTTDDIIENQMRYASRKTPEQRKRARMEQFVDSADTDDELEQPPRRKKTLKEVTEETQEAHKAMCQQATESMGLMTRVLLKLEKKLDEL